MLGHVHTRRKAKHEKEPLSGQADCPAKPIQEVTLSDEKENKLPVESNLSPERIMDGASTATALLNQILAQQEETHQLRDYLKQRANLGNGIYMLKVEGLPQLQRIMLTR